MVTKFNTYKGLVTALNSIRDANVATDPDSATDTDSDSDSDIPQISNYYTTLATNFDLILKQMYITSQGRVAHDLKMTTLKLSSYTVMFKELYYNGYTVAPQPTDN